MESLEEKKILFFEINIICLLKPVNFINGIVIFTEGLAKGSFLIISFEMISIFYFLILMKTII